ncbi:MAG: hypothetical protein KDJ52_27385, partial [Anaerolineae bacterium]|nr:hypothetical protein [Anaerolineae bacterium]
MLRKLLYLLALCVSITLLLAACGGTVNDAVEEAQEEPAATEEAAVEAPAAEEPAATEEAMAEAPAATEEAMAEAPAEEDP